jgi:hypothetical protein
MKLDLMLATVVAAVTCAGLASLIAATPGLAGRQHLNRYDYQANQGRPQWHRPSAVTAPLSTPGKMIRRTRHLRRT